MCLSITLTDKNFDFDSCPCTGVKVYEKVVSFTGDS